MTTTIKAILGVIMVLFYSCENKNEATVLKQIADLPKELKEISGIAYSNNLLYTIEDSGNPNEVVVIDTLGKIIKTIYANSKTTFFAGISAW